MRARARTHANVRLLHTHVDKVINKNNWGSFTRLDLPGQHLLLRLLFFRNSRLKHIENTTGTSVRDVVHQLLLDGYKLLHSLSGEIRNLNVKCVLFVDFEGETAT